MFIHCLCLCPLRSKVAYWCREFKGTTFKINSLESLVQISCSQVWFPGPNSYRGIFWSGQLMCLQLGKSRIGVNWAVFEQLVDRQVDFDLTKIFALKFLKLSVVSWRCNHQMT